MTHRIEITRDEQTVRIEFEGALDAKALADILSSIEETRRRGGKRIALVLRPGTEISRDCIEPLRMIDGFEGLTVEPMSPFLARWLKQTTNDVE